MNTETRSLALITRIMAQLLSRNHYRQQALDAGLSKQLFDEYLDELDPAKIYFTEEDVAKFSADRDLLCRQLQSGDSSFAFKVYDCFRTRNGEFRAFAEKRLKEPFDFTLDESFMLDRTKAPRAKDRAELEKLWYLRLKNDVLAYRLMNRVQEEERAKQPEKASGEERENAAAAKWEIRNPAEKVLSRLRDINNDIQQKDRVDILGIYLNSLAPGVRSAFELLPAEAGGGFRDVDEPLALRHRRDAVERRRLHQDRRPDAGRSRRAGREAEGRRPHHRRRPGERRAGGCDRHAADQGGPPDPRPREDEGHSDDPAG